MEKYSRLVIDLYKEAVQHQVNPDRILEVHKEIANAITAARIQGEPDQWLQSLLEDLKPLEQ